MVCPKKMRFWIVALILAGLASTIVHASTDHYDFSSPTTAAYHDCKACFHGDKPAAGISELVTAFLTHDSAYQKTNTPTFIFKHPLRNTQPRAPPSLA